MLAVAYPCSACGGTSSGDGAGMARVAEAGVVTPVAPDDASETDGAGSGDGPAGRTGRGAEPAIEETLLARYLELADRLIPPKDSANAERCVASDLGDPDSAAREVTTTVAPDAVLAELPTEQQLPILQVAVQCAGPAIADDWASTPGTDPDARLSTCYLDAMTAEAGKLALVYEFGGGLAVDFRDPDDYSSEVKDAWVASQVGCPAFLALASSAYSEHIELGAVDDRCLTETIAAIDTTIYYESRAYTGLLSEEAEALKAEALDALTGCISYGIVLAAVASDVGVELTGFEIGCIDGLVDSTDPEIVDGFLPDTILDLAYLCLPDDKFDAFLFAIADEPI
jgi:hypothetical protein